MRHFDASSAFAGASVPSWLGAFAERPLEAVDALLFGYAKLGRLAATGPEELLLDWLAGLGNRGGFQDALDEALAAWVESRWGIYEHRGMPVVLTARAWVALGEVVEHGGLALTARALRPYLETEDAFLASLVEGRSRDPLLRAWLAVGRYQTDDTLVERWWGWCHTPDNQPWYRGEIGVCGLMRAPEARDSLTRLAGGLAAWANALKVRVDGGWFDLASAREEVRRLVVLIRATMPMRERWEDAVRNAPFPDGWLVGILPPARARVTSSEHFPDFPRRAQAIANQLGRRMPGAERKAEALLSETRAYARAAGLVGFFVMSACNFAGKVNDFSLARRWLSEARRLDPQSPHGWTQGSELALGAGDYEEAIYLGAEAVRRFPRNPVSSLVYAQAYHLSGDYVRAELVYRGALARFPTEDAFANGIVTTLRDAGRLPEAEIAAREATEQMPYSRAAWYLLADVLDRQDKREEARVALEEGFQKAGFDEHLDRMQRRLAGNAIPPLHLARRRAEAGTVRPLLPLLVDASLLRAWIGAPHPASTPAMWRAEAEAILQGLETVDDPRAVAEQGFVSMELQQLERALDLLRRARDRYPGSAHIALALARAERRHAETSGGVMGDACASYARLESVDARLRPVRLLGEVRVRSAEDPDARDSLGRLAWALARFPDTENWAEQVRAAIFGERHVKGADDIDDPRPFFLSVRAQARALDNLEEERVSATSAI